ncbi:MAG: NAD(P)H-hydrate dehydratase [Luteimonas sp.]
MEPPVRGVEALFDNAASRRIEAAATDALGDSALMDRAGHAAWHCLLSRWPQARRIVVACGPGNNGGDGYVLARHALEAGRDVGVVRLSPPRTALAQRACAAFEHRGGRVTAFDGALPDCDLLVDALFGIGLSRPPDAQAASVIATINQGARDVFAIDVPSGVDADTGHVPGAAVRATATLQMLVAHVGLVTGAALDACGALLLDRLHGSPDDADVTAFALRVEALPHWLRPRLRDSHKGDNGHVLCIGGDHGSGGAIALCAQAALRSGAGLVSVATHGEHVPAILGERPEAMVSRTESATDLLRLAERADVIAVGPGLGQGEWGGALWRSALECGKPLVADADALNLLAQHPRALPSDCIITPHPGEAARLLGRSTNDVQRDRYAAARELAVRFGCVVVLKGAGTILAAHDRRPRVVVAGNPGMAGGGMGDLLTGVIAALRAQGLDAFDAACCGALLHACAGDVAARDGERGLLASDLLPELRRLSNPGIA